MYHAGFSLWVRCVYAMCVLRSINNLFEHKPLKDKQNLKNVFPQKRFNDELH